MLLPSWKHCTGFLWHTGLTTLTSLLTHHCVYGNAPTYTKRNYWSLTRPQAPSALSQPTPWRSSEPSGTAWVIECSAQLPPSNSCSPWLSESTTDCGSLEKQPTCLPLVFTKALPKPFYALLRYLTKVFKLSLYHIEISLLLSALQIKCVIIHYY